MRKIQTHISFADYQRMFKDKEFVGATKSEFYKLLEPAIIEIENDTLEVIMFFLDAWISAQIFSGKKFVGSQVMVIQEYVKRVLKTEEVQKLQEEISKRARENTRKFLTFTDSSTSPRKVGRPRNSSYLKADPSKFTSEITEA